MDLKIGDIQETALITLAIRASETDRPNARIKDYKAKEIIDTLGVDVSKYDPFMSHEGVVARTIMYKKLEASRCCEVHECRVQMGNQIGQGVS